MDKIVLFERTIKEHDSILIDCGYQHYQKTEFNSNSEDFFVEYTYKHPRLKKWITFRYKINDKYSLKGRLVIIITKEDDSSVNFSELLFYIKSNFTATGNIDENLSRYLISNGTEFQSSMSEILESIFRSFTKPEVLEIICGQKWIKVPAADPRDQY